MQRGGNGRGSGRKGAGRFNRRRRQPLGHGRRGPASDGRQGRQGLQAGHSGAAGRISGNAAASAAGERARAGMAVTPCRSTCDPPVASDGGRAVRNRGV